MGRNGGGRNFKKGNPGGPGRPPVLPELKGIEPMTKDTYSRLLNKTMSMSREELKAVLNDPNASVKDLALAAIASRAISNGDPQRWESILNRAIGPVKQEASVDATITVKVEDYT
jgi:hypothetical protein